MEGMFLPLTVQSKIVDCWVWFSSHQCWCFGFPRSSILTLRRSGQPPDQSISIWWVGQSTINYLIMYSFLLLCKLLIFHMESSTYSISSIHSLFNTCNGLSQGNKICLGTEGCVNRFGDISPKPGRFAHMGLWDRGAHSQSETPIIWGQSGESTAPRTKGVLSPTSHHPISCFKERLWSTTV